MRLPAPTLRPSLRLALLVGAVCAAAIAALWVLIGRPIAAQRADQDLGLAIGRALLVLRPHLYWFFHDLPPVVFLPLLLGLGALGAFLRGPRAAAFATLVPVTCLCVVEVLKLLLHRPSAPGLVYDEFPSGHTAAAGGLAMGLAVLVGRWWAVLIALAVTAAAGVAMVVPRLHRPSDAVASLLVVAAVGALALTCLAAPPRPD